jgi:hypothetical protein
VVIVSSRARVCGGERDGAERHHAYNPANHNLSQETIHIPHTSLPKIWVTLEFYVMNREPDNERPGNKPISFPPTQTQKRSPRITPNKPKPTLNLPATVP